MASIDKLLDVFVASDGTTYYQVKWKPTWEKADVLGEHSELIENFWKNIHNIRSANVLKNQSNIPKPDPVIPRSISNAPPAQSFPGSTAANNSKVTPKRKKPVSAQRHHQNNILPSPHSRLNHQTAIPRVPTNNFSSHQNNLQLSQSLQSTVIIDSDEENDLRQNMMSMQSQSQVQPQQLIPGQWDHHQQLQVKSEPVDVKPFLDEQTPFAQSPQQIQHFNFPPDQMVANNQFPGFHQGLVAAGRGSTRGRGGGRGRGSRGGGPSPAKRKLGLPVVGSPKSNAQLGNVKIEMTDDKELSTLVSLSDWKQHFEKVESLVDGETAVSYQCTICGSRIAQQSNCSRHFKAHTTDGSGEHACPICGKTFYRLDYIERHLKSHGSGNAEELERMIKLILAGMKK